MANTANLAQPQVFINYISQRKKIIVNDHNQPSQLLIQTDYYLNDTLYFKIINVNNQIVELDNNTTYQLYGTYLDAKKTVHILFYTLGVTPRDNTLEFIANTYTSQYLAYVKNNNTPINISIVAKQTVGSGTRSYMVLRDNALANPRGYIEGQAPTDIVYQNVFNAEVPVTGAFGAGNNIDLAQDLEGQDVGSFAFGDTLTTNNANQFVVGYNNTPDATKAFIVANSGNIFTVDYDGNIEAKGNLDVGAISATSITVSGEDINSLVDDKVEYLSTSVDGKLEATSAWATDTFEPISTATEHYNELTASIDLLESSTGEEFSATSAWAIETFETKIAATESYNSLAHDINDLSTEAYSAFELKTDATGKFETLTGQTNYLSGQIDATNDVVNQVTNTLASKADKSALNELSGQVQGITVPTKVSELQNDVPYLSSIPTSYVQESQLEDYATVASLTSYAQKTEVPVLSSSISAFLAEGDNIKLTVNDQTGVVTISGTAAGSGGEGKTYTGASGIVVDNDNDVIGISATNLVTTEQLGEELNDYTKTTDLADYISSNVLTGYVTTGWIEEQEFATTGSLNTASTTLLNSINDLDDDVDYLSSIITGKANQTALDELSGVVSANTADITVLKGVSGTVDYSTVFDMLSSGDADTLTITKDTTNEKIVFTAAGGGSGGDKTYHGASGIAVDNVNDIISISASYLSSNALEGYATQAWVGEQGYLTQVPNTYALKTDIPTDVATSTHVQSASGNAVDVATGWVDGKNYLTEVPSEYVTETELSEEGFIKDIPTSYVQRTELSAYATSSWVDQNYAKVGDVPTDVYTKTEVNAISTALSTTVSEAGYLTSVPNTVSAAAVEAATGWVNEQGYLTEVPNTYALKTDIPTTVAELTDSSDYALKTDLPTISTYVGGNLISVTSSDTNQYTIAFTGTIPSVEGLASETYVNNAIDALSDVYAKTTDLETYETTDNVATLCTALSTAITGKADSADIPTSNSGLTNDAHYITSSDIPTSYVQKDEISAMATTGYVTGYCSAFITQANIPSTVSQLVNDSQFITNASLVDYAQLSDIPTDVATSAYVQAASGNAVDVATGWVNDKNYLTGVDLTDYALKSEIPTVPTNVGDFTNNVGYLTAVPSEYITQSELSAEGFLKEVPDTYATKQWVEDKNYLTGVDLSNYATTGFVTGYCSAFITAEDIPAQTEYTAGTGLKLDGTEFSISAAGAGEDKVLSSHNGVISWEPNVAGGGGTVTVDTICGMLSSANTNTLTITKSGDYIVLSAATGSGGGGGADDTADLTNGAGFITLSSITNKQRAYPQASSQITYDPAVEVFKTTYTVDANNGITLVSTAFDDFTLGADEIATFEDWVYTATACSATVGAGLTLIGDIPSELAAGTYHVFVRRIVADSNADVKEYISFAYEVPTV